MVSYEENGHALNYIFRFANIREWKITYKMPLKLRAPMKNMAGTSKILCCNWLMAAQATKFIIPVYT